MMSHSCISTSLPLTVNRLLKRSMLRLNKVGVHAPSERRWSCWVRGCHLSLTLSVYSSTRRAVCLGLSLINVFFKRCWRHCESVVEKIVIGWSSTHYNVTAYIPHEYWLLNCTEVLIFQHTSQGKSTNQMMIWSELWGITIIKFLFWRWISNTFSRLLYHQLSTRHNIYFGILPR